MQTEWEVETAKVSRASQPSVAVEIYDQIYHLRGVDPVAIEQLAATVDAKMRAVSAQGGTVDSLRVAVLAALNLADELTLLRERYDALAGSVASSESSMRSRAGSLSGMLDEMLGDTVDSQQDSGGDANHRSHFDIRRAG